MSTPLHIHPMRIIVVDDSAFSRQTIKGILEKASNIEVVAVAYNGQDAIKKIHRFRPDAITLDLEMPLMDGYTLLRWLMKEHPMPVIVISSHKHRTTVFKAMELGAVDFVVKPTKRASEELEMIEEDLLNKLSSLDKLRLEKLQKNIELLDQKEILHKVGTTWPNKVDIVAMGASTGGPTAIQSIISRFPSDFPAAILITQHMPGGFTRQFADRMNRLSLLKVTEAKDAQPVEIGKIFVCPGDHHMKLKKMGDMVYIQLVEPTAGDRYVPSIDTMMKNAARVYRDRLLGVILTGMGNDGKEGMLEIKRQGGITIAESEETSVVYGMSREVIQSGSADMVLPLEDIPLKIMKSLKRPKKTTGK